MVESGHLLDDLTESQRQAVTHVDGPLLIIAGAGSGKTRVITRRVAWLIGLGIPPSSVLAITFTNKAAGEMKSRVGALLDRGLRDFGRLDQPWPILCTFHSLCLRILRHYAARVGLPASFSIYDSADQTRVIKEVLKALEISDSRFTPASVHAVISKAKNHLLLPGQFAAGASDFYEKTVARVYAKYQEMLSHNGALDFDDLLLFTAAAFRDHPDVLAELQERFQYLLIDEYQDTNHAQYILAHALAQKHRNICVVGDPDQSIYGWRGADIANILDFEKDYPDAKVVKLEQNYRSTKTILHLAATLIAHNGRRKPKDLWTQNPQGGKARLFLCYDERDEAAMIASQLRAIHDQQGRAWEQMAVFYRVNSLSRVMEDALRKAGIPYQIARGVEFYNRKEIKDVLAYLRVVANPADEVSLNRIVNVPARGLGDASFKVIEAYAVGHAMGLWTALEHAAGIAGLSARAVQGAARLVSLIGGLRDAASGRSIAHGPTRVEDPHPNPPPEYQGRGQGRIGEGAGVRQIMETLLERSGLDAALKKELQSDPEFDGLANVNELITSAAEFEKENPQGTLLDYLAAVSLVSDVDRLGDGGGAVTLMTLHAAKGLEFPVVAIIGLEDGLLPHSRANESPDEAEEERRLCFVGITRAREQLLLSRAARRMVRGISGMTVGSRFLRELPAESMEIFDHAGQGSDEPSERRFEPDSQETGPQLRRGVLVRHRIFGMGRVAEASRSGGSVRVVVEFNAGGRKILIMPPAVLEEVG